jgi:ribosomal protein S19
VNLPVIVKHHHYYKKIIQQETSETQKKKIRAYSRNAQFYKKMIYYIINIPTIT